ncbi:hypothetical protein GCM10023306_06710 [Novosphingobium ginsenosidimutans]
MRLDPRYFAFEQRDPFSQFILRKAVERFQRQLAGGIAARTGAVVIVHPRRKIDFPALAVNTAKG